MLNEEGNKIDIKINRSNSRKELKKTIARAARFLSFFAVVLHHYSAVL